LYIQFGECASSRYVQPALPVGNVICPSETLVSVLQLEPQLLVIMSWQLTEITSGPLSFPIKFRQKGQRNPGLNLATGNRRRSPPVQSRQIGWWEIQETVCAYDAQMYSYSRSSLIPSV
jgi:hypothetical protein